MITLHLHYYARMKEMPANIRNPESENPNVDVMVKPDNIIEKRYIGDAVFVDFDGYHIVLTTSDGLVDTNRICLEPSVYLGLIEFEADLRQEIANAQQGDTHKSG